MSFDSVECNVHGDCVVCEFGDVPFKMPASVGGESARSLVKVRLRFSDSTCATDCVVVGSVAR